MNKFERYFHDPIYLQLKNNLFNYILRRYSIRKEFKEFKKYEHSHKILDIGSGVSPVSPMPDYTIFADMSIKAMTYLLKEHKKVVVTDICAIGFHKNTFDVIVCSEVLEHVQNDRSALKELFHVLKNRGSLVLTVPLHSYYLGSDDTIAGHKRRYSLDELYAKLKEAGFAVTKITKISGPLERFSTFAVTNIFVTLENGKRRKIPRPVMSLYKVINHFYAFLLYIEGKIWPIQFSSVVLIVCVCKK